MLILKQRKTITNPTRNYDRTVRVNGSKQTETSVSKQKEMLKRKKKTCIDDKKIQRTPSKVMKKTCMEDHEQVEEASGP
ncbi:hypothetical protein ACJMK2_009399, partial [Sinanodonta woodiana]